MKTRWLSTLRAPGFLTRTLVLAFVAVFLVSAAPAWGQGLPTGTISGRVTNDNLPLPGVSVTAKAPTLQGSRTVVTAASGDYVLVDFLEHKRVNRSRASGYSCRM